MKFWILFQNRIIQNNLLILKIQFYEWHYWQLEFRGVGCTKQSQVSQLAIALASCTLFEIDVWHENSVLTWPEEQDQRGCGGSSTSSNWILMSCQPCWVTSGQSNPGHKQVHISKLFSYICVYQPSVKSVYKTNHFANIKHTYTNIRHKFLKS